MTPIATAAALLCCLSTTAAWNAAHSNVRSPTLRCRQSRSLRMVHSDLTHTPRDAALTVSLESIYNLGRTRRNASNASNRSSSNSNSATRKRPSARKVPVLADYNQQLEACAGSGAVGDAVALIHEMRKKGVLPCAESYCAAARAAATAAANSMPAAAERALLLVRDLEASGLQLDAATATAVIQACTAAGQPLKALQVWDKLAVTAAVAAAVAPSQSDALLSSAAYSAALEACAAAQDWQRSLVMLQSMREQRVPISTAAYTAAVAACSAAGQWEMVLLVLAEQLADGQQPEPAAYTSALQGCAATGNW
jgi:PPR repeat